MSPVIVSKPGRRRGRSRLASQAPGAGVPGGTTAGALANAYAATLVLDGRDRQRVLEALSVRERVQRVTEILTTQRPALAPPGRGPLN